MSRVRIGTCANPAEAALVRSVFDAHGLRVVINAEQHASMLGGLGGAFVPLHIYVAEEDREQAEALLRDVIHAEPALDDDDGDDDGDADDAADAPDDAGASQVHSRVERRKRGGIVMLLACCVTFGTAHMYTGAWLRGMALAGAEILGFRYLGVDPRIGAALLVGCVAFDLIGGLLRVRGASTRGASGTLPEARISSRTRS